MNLAVDIWKVLTSSQRRWALGAQVVSIVMAFSTVVGIASIAPFFSVLGNPQSIDQNALLHRLYQFGFTTRESFTIALGLAFMGLVLLANLINVVGSFVLIRMASSIGSELQSTLFGEYLQRPYLFHARTQGAVLFNNIIHETTRTTNQILQNGFSLMTNVITAVFIMVPVMWVNPAIAVSMTVALAGGYVLIYLAVRNRLLRAGEIESQFLIEQTKIVNESLRAIKEILLLRIQQFFRGSFERSSQAFARAAARSRLIAQIPRYIMECVAVAGVVAAALAADGADGIGARLGQLTFLGFAAYRLLPTLQQAFAASVRIRADHAGFAAISADLRLARARKDLIADADSTWRGRPRSEIRLEQVYFRYERDRPPAVAGVSLRIPARAAVGFVGPNGSGKTTLVDLIAGLLVPEAGRMEVDGIALDDVNIPLWRSRIAYVSQDVFLLDTSIAQNIALGIPARSIDRERLQAAAKFARLDEFAATLPGGYEYRVGERGVRLSGGQRQRIGIARASYTEASVLILDEATNALDGLTEQELMATIVGLRGHHTIIVISHRLSTVRACDVIYQLDQGQISGSGTYLELIESSAVFRRLAEART
jgi:HlyD family secretion protein